MTGVDIGLQSLDAVTSGNWLVCTRGPIQYKKDGKSFYPPEWEGVLVNVLAVSPPMLLVRVFPFPGNGGGNKALELALHWDRQRFGKATQSYVDEYLKLAGFRPDGKRLRGETPPIPPVPINPMKRKKKSMTKAKTIDEIINGLQAFEEDNRKRTEGENDGEEGDENV